MPERKSLSKKVRFEVFKRDSFTCQYCGRSAPDVVLEVDHIMPVVAGGENDITNLISSCRECNSGKGGRELSDDAVVAKRKSQLDELQERREQLEMMLEWHKGLTNLEYEQIEAACSLFQDAAHPYSITENGKATIKKLVNKYGIGEILDCIRLSVSQYIVRGADGQATADSVAKAFEYIGRIAAVRQKDAKKPYLRELYYIRGIIRNRLSYCNETEALRLLETAYLNGHDLDELKHLACQCGTWSSWRSNMEVYENTKGMAWERDE